MEFLKRNQIDEKKWNDCVLKSSNGLVYALTWFLDGLAMNWCAYVREDKGCYVSVFPVPYKRKFGIKYVYTPFFIQQLGLFSLKYSKKEEEEVIYMLKKNWKFIELNLNFSSKNGESRKNLVLSLPSEYSILQKSYSKNHFRNLKKSEHIGLVLKREVSPEKTVDLFRSNRGAKLKTFSNSDYQNLLSLCNEAKSKNALFSMGVECNSELVCAGIFIKFKNRITFLFSGNSKKGKDSGALFFLIDSVIKRYAKSGFILDFEGSENEGLNRFYSGFGSSEENYRVLKINNLPRVIKAFKN